MKKSERREQEELDEATDVSPYTSVFEEDVEEISARAEESGRFEQFEPDCRHHYGVTYANEADAAEFEEYSIAYRYGMGLAEQKSLRNDNWSDIEHQVREGWESREEGTWERFQEAVYYGWNSIRGDHDLQRPESRQ